MVDFFNPAGRGTGIQGSIDAVQSLFDGIEERDRKEIQQQAAQGGIGSDAFKSLVGLDPTSATKLKGLLQTDDQGLDAAFQDASVFQNLLQNDPSGQSALQFGVQRMQAGEQSGRNMIHTQRFLEEIQADPSAALGSIGSFLDIPNEIGKRSVKGAGQVEFESDIAGLSEEKQKEAVLIKLGLSPRAVGSAIQTISDKGIQEQIGKVKATIRQREKFGELTASRRSKVIDTGFGKIEKINGAIQNIDRAITVLNSGAGVGAIQKFLPSFKAASVELDNIQKSMALDVIGSVTFGALSEGELNLAKEVALPTGLDTPQLIDYLNRRKDAQNKLRDYYGEQIQFLDQGGTIAGFMRSKEREQAQQPTADSGNEFAGFKVVR